MKSKRKWMNEEKWLVDKEEFPFVRNGVVKKKKKRICGDYSAILLPLSRVNQGVEGCCIPQLSLQQVKKRFNCRTLDLRDVKAQKSNRGAARFLFSLNEGGELKKGKNVNRDMSTNSFHFYCQSNTKWLIVGRVFFFKQT